MRPDVVLPAERALAARAGGFWRDQTLLDDFERNLDARPDQLAVCGHSSMTCGEVRLTTRQLDRQVRRIAAGLLKRGVQFGDVVSAQLPNWWEMVAMHLAALRVGAIFNPLLPVFRERELLFMLAFAESKVIVAPERFRGCEHGAMLERLRPSLPHLRHVLVVGGRGEGSFEQMLDEDPGDVDTAVRERRPSPDDVIQLLFTSGTTGEPKGVMHTSNTLMATLWQQLRIQGFDDTDVTLISSPLASQQGFLYGIMKPVMTGGRVVLQDIWDPKEAVGLIARERVTFSIGSTPYLADLLDAATGRREELRTLRLFVAGGAPIPRHLVRRAAQDFGLTVCSLWGMSENGPVAFTRADDSPSKAMETDGCAVPGMELRIADQAGGSLPAGAEGRLLVRGAGMFVGYFKRPELYSTDSEGWFDTGDLARMDEDGYIRITGRTKDVIIRGGQNIPVVEVENLLYEHTAVAEAAIVAMPDPRLGERGCVFVVLRPGHTLTLAELCAYLLSRQCAKTYLPERLEIVQAMPRTASGKIQKFLLREQARQFGSPPAD